MVSETSAKTTPPVINIIPHAGSVASSAHSAASSAAQSGGSSASSSSTPPGNKLFGAKKKAGASPVGSTATGAGDGGGNQNGNVSEDNMLSSVNASTPGVVRSQSTSTSKKLFSRLVGYDPYSGSLTDHYELGQVLGKGAYGEVVAARLRPRSRLFSGVCVACCLSSKRVEAIIAAPDLDELIDSFRNKRNINGSRRTLSNLGTISTLVLNGASMPLRGVRGSVIDDAEDERIDPPRSASGGGVEPRTSQFHRGNARARGMEHHTGSRSTQAGRISLFQRLKGAGGMSPASVLPSIGNEDDVTAGARFSKASLGGGYGGRASTGGRQRMSLMTRSLVPGHSFSRTSLAGAQSFVTSESFVKRICSYDEAALRPRPSPNDALRRAATASKKQAWSEQQSLLERLQPVQAWTFAVKCMKKVALVEEEAKTIQLIEKRIQILLRILEGDTTEDTLVKLKGTNAAASANLLLVPDFYSSGNSSKHLSAAAGGAKKKLSFILGGLGGAGDGASQLVVPGSGPPPRGSQAGAITMNQLGLPVANQGGGMQGRRSYLNNTHTGSRGSILRAPLLVGGEKGMPLSVDMYDGNQKLFRTALEIELKELGQRKKEMTKDLKSVSESAVLKELRLLALCRHKNVLYLVEAFEDDRWMYVVVERCYGDFTSRYTSSRPLPINVAKRVIFQVLLALQHLHKLLVIHRDIKPENILFKNPDHPLLLPDVVVGDFGMAMQMQHRGSVCNEIAGSAAFMAPETWRQNGYQHFKSDIWATGVCLYEMLYQALPFHATSHTATANAMAKERWGDAGVRGGEFCDLAYKLGSIGIRLAMIVVAPGVMPAYGVQRGGVNDDLVTQEARDTAELLLTKDPQLRRSAGQALALPWFRDLMDDDNVSGSSPQTGH
ncbi:unnamed protein product [Amoebophrya sp. A25]|nr:unnamed protein product [Amoebophrya sp. A25]|eukprot:GSA25T00024125001.1